MNSFVYLGFLVVGVMVGAVISWLLMRGRIQLQIQAAVVRIQSASQIDLAQKEERLRATLEEIAKLRVARDLAAKEFSELRSELDQSRNEQARLSERSSRVPQLEADLKRLLERVQEGEDESRALATSEAQQRQLATSLDAKVAELAKDIEGLGREASQCRHALNEANERKAALEEQAALIPTLEDKLGATETQLEETSKQLSDLRESSGRSNGKLTAELAAEQGAHALAREQRTAEADARVLAEGEVARLSSELTELRTSYDAERKHAEEKLQLLTQAKEELSAQFKALATEILEEKSKRFTEQNQTSLGQLLEPLKVRLKEFQGKVEEVYVQETKDRSALAEQVRQLHALNQALSDDARNLTSALKGSSKTQGNWGELILERVLESSGLRKGHEYLVQDSQTREDGSRAQPDVVILLPEERKLVVDSKVSLVAYEAYASAETDEKRSISLRQHVESIRSHIKSLSDKKYHALYGKSLDFVLAFVPIEPAFMLAITNDKDIFMEALNRNVLLVSPSTLLFVVRTVAHLWRQEAQNRNAQDIARRGAELYEKLCGFVDDFESVGKRLKQAQSAFDSAQGKLATGRGNVIRQATMLRELGVKPSKVLPAALVELANEDEQSIIVGSALVENNDARAMFTGTVGID
ncbi:DNA recombination protein RmuC [Caballeronia novacaledonica]|uniref:DNA recombination protein RmuC n=1 Tax=Caballeronia novacaledonica TaxID=1544861 RepID=A0AA37IMW0_9BURK|nr:DNA recombination protein RmuC [Caballeronia novacaledonica]GJH29255.1 DNA recombination protein RmuC [Caballeronia novacaledonica]